LVARVVRRIAILVAVGLVSATAAANVPLDSPAPAPTAPQKSSVPPTTGGPAVDSEAPRQTRHPSAGEEAAATNRLGSGFGVGVGYAGGGDTLATVMFQNGSTEDLKAGEGVSLDITGVATPFWPWETVGFGIGAELALKYRSVGGAGGSISFTRVPAIAFVQLLAPAGPRGAFLLRAGPEWDLVAHVGGDGIASQLSADLSSHVGFVAEVGNWYQPSHRGSVTLTFRFTHLNYAVGSHDIDATNYGLMLGYLFDPR
jgi:hypothetical protein